MKKKNDGVKAVGRVSAVIAMVVLILAAIPVGACISLSRERNNVTAEYYGSGGFGSGRSGGGAPRAGGGSTHGGGAGRRR